MADNEVNHYFILEFEFDKEGTKLKLKGPEITNKVSPRIKVYKKHGRFVFEIGVEVHEIDSEDVGEALKKLFGEGEQGVSTFGPVAIRMPDKFDLRRGGTDETYISFEEYKQKVKNSEDSARNGLRKTVFQKIPKPVYEALIRYYRISDLTKDGKYPLFL